MAPAGAFVQTYLFKMVSHMQSRLGPMEAGPHGVLQAPVELLKFLQKEDLFPERADRFVFGAAPFVVFVSTSEVAMYCLLSVSVTTSPWL